MPAPTRVAGLEPSAGNDKSAPISSISDDAIDNEIRILQSMETQRNMPVIIPGLMICIGIVLYLDWPAAISSNAFYFLILEFVLLLPMLRSYMRLRTAPRPTSVSKRRIQILEIYSLTSGMVWAAIIFLIMRELSPLHGIVLFALICAVCFAGAALNSCLPKAAAGFAGPMLISFPIAAFTNDIVRPELIAILVGSVWFGLAQTIWRNWLDAKASVRLSLEVRMSESEAHRRETEAMRAMIEAIPFPLVLTRETGTLEASASAAQQFGIPTGEVGGRVIRDFFVNPEDQDALIAVQAKEGRLVEHEVQLKDAHGKPFWALLSSLPLKYEGEDCWLNAIYVIDDRKRAEAETLEAKQRAEETSQMLETVSRQLSKYISPQLYQSVFRGEQRVEIETKRKKLTIFFSDIAGFTEISDQLESEELTTLLNEYLTEMSIVARQYGAYFDKFIGDAMIFYFGDPETLGVREDAAACVRMAIAMQRRLRHLQQEWRERGLIDRPCETRIGINTGYCTVGNFGSEDRMDYTIIGGEVNLAARLEAEAEPGGIRIANETYSLTKDWLDAEEQEAVSVKGFANPIKTYRVKGIYDEPAAPGRVIRSELDGMSLTIDYDRLERMGKHAAIHEIKEAIAQLET